eukprot:5248843-Heterocapsa_arctica.AAC.1
MLYGLESLSLTEADQAKLDAFQIRGLRNIFGIKHYFWSCVTNKDIICQANTRARLPTGKCITKISDKLILRQLTLFGHLLRAEDSDIMKSEQLNQMDLVCKQNSGV